MYHSSYPSLEVSCRIDVAGACVRVVGMAGSRNASAVEAGHQQELSEMAFTTP